MRMLRYFWDVAIGLDPAAEDLDQTRQFPLRNPDRLRELFDDAGLVAVKVRAIDAPAVSHDFEDYWSPFFNGKGPRAPRLCHLFERRPTSHAQGATTIHPAYPRRWLHSFDCPRMGRLWIDQRVMGL
jgi:hypothetical protein